MSDSSNGCIIAGLLYSATAAVFVGSGFLAWEWTEPNRFPNRMGNFNQDRTFYCFLDCDGYCVNIRLNNYKTTCYEIYIYLIRYFYAGVMPA